MSAAFVLSTQAHGRTSSVQKVQFPNLQALGEYVTRAPATDDKVASRGVVGATFSGNVRANENLQQCTGASLDFDKPIDAEQFEAVTAVLESENIGFVAHGTWSNHGRFAVIIPFANPTDLAGHAAAVTRLRDLLGPYGNFAEESTRPGQVRFVSPNPQYLDRKVKVFDGALLDVPATGEALPSNATSIAPIPPKPAADRFQIYSDQASPEQKALFLVALRHDLIPNRVDDYTRWQPLLYAGFRAWAITSKQLTESQRELLEALTEWSKRSSKYKPGCVEDKLSDWLRERSARSALYIHSILAVEVDQSAMRYAISQEPDAGMLSAAYSAMLGQGEITSAVEVIDPAAATEALTERQKQASEIESVRRAGQVILNEAPHATPRFVEFLDLVTEVATQGKVLEHWELKAEHPDTWDFFLSPVPVLMTLAQIASMGFMPHTLFRAVRGRAPFSLAMWFLHIAAQASGKTEVHKNTQPILDGTVFKHSYQKEKFFSATGMWSKFERFGNVQLLFSDEGESLFGKSGHLDGNLATLHSAAKQLKDEGRPNSVYTPNSQVQREVRALRAPTLMFNLAGTSALLNDIPEDMWIDGFLSRFACVYINPVDRSQETREQKLAREIAELGAADIDDIDTRTVRAVKFFNKLWNDSGHPAGPEFFAGIDDFGGGRTLDELVGSIQAHFEQVPRPGMPRYIEVCDPADLDARRKFGEVFMDAESRWDFPPDAGYARAAGAIKARAKINLQILAAVLTLIADPHAKTLNYDITVWAEKFLFHSQIGVYEWLQKKAAVASQSGGLLRFETKRIDTLRPALEPGGLLFNGDVVKARDLRDKYTSWRKLIDDLRAPGEANKMVRQTAEQILYQLGVQAEQTGKALVFSMTPQRGAE